MGTWGTQSESWSKWVPTQSYLHCLISKFNKAIDLRMSYRTRNKFGIHFPHKKIAEFRQQGRVSIKHNDLWNTMKSRTMFNKESRSFVSSDFLWHERKCAISDGKHKSKIVVEWNSELLVISMTKSIPTISQE